MIKIQPGNYAGVIVNKCVNVIDSGSVIVNGSLALTTPSCRVFDITVKASGKDAAVGLDTCNNQLARCTMVGIAMAFKVMVRMFSYWIVGSIRLRV